MESIFWVKLILNDIKRNKGSKYLNVYGPREFNSFGKDMHNICRD